MSIYVKLIENLHGTSFLSIHLRFSSKVSVLFIDFIYEGNFKVPIIAVLKVIY